MPEGGADSEVIQPSNKALPTGLEEGEEGARLRTRGCHGQVVGGWLVRETRRESDAHSLSVRHLTLHRTIADGGGKQ